jgi:hypothetical protein
MALSCEHDSKHLGFTNHENFFITKRLLEYEYYFVHVTNYSQVIKRSETYLGIKYDLNHISIPHHL